MLAESTRRVSPQAETATRFAWALTAAIGLQARMTRQLAFFLQLEGQYANEIVTFGAEIERVRALRGPAGAGTAGLLFDY